MTKKNRGTQVIKNGANDPSSLRYAETLYSPLLIPDTRYLNNKSALGGFFIHHVLVPIKNLWLMCNHLQKRFAMEYKVSKDQLNDYMFKARRKMSSSFMAFLINVVLMVAFWLVSLTGFYFVLLEYFMLATPYDVYMYTYSVLGIWQILNIVLNLTPALASWWDMSIVRGRYMK
ncbi:MAG: hypothetical protein LBI82_07090 [Dysgonamonadaceae bacterium]|jgi:hypothetical protein|nr:hypothetical protein [Dysgonamonadaceae bacterium]